jgi:hypothetical protein
MAQWYQDNLPNEAVAFLFYGRPLDTIGNSLRSFTCICLMAVKGNFEPIHRHSYQWR